MRGERSHPLSFYVATGFDERPACEASKVHGFDRDITCDDLLNQPKHLPPLDAPGLHFSWGLASVLVMAYRQSAGRARWSPRCG